ncbi:MAG: hypothetical protein ABSC34_06065 [Acidimicrobiales bacterium]|jgi:hypothetical protein
MYGTVGWIVILVAGLAMELASRLGAVRTPNLTRTGALVATRIVGRIVLLLFWLFVGLHLFTRYTLPGH